MPTRWTLFQFLQYCFRRTRNILLAPYGSRSCISKGAHRLNVVTYVKSTDSIHFLWTAGDLALWCMMDTLWWVYAPRRRNWNQTVKLVSADKNVNQESVTVCPFLSSNVLKHILVCYLAEIEEISKNVSAWKWMSQYKALSNFQYTPHTIQSTRLSWFVLARTDMSAP